MISRWSNHQKMIRLDPSQAFISPFSTQINGRSIQFLTCDLALPLLATEKVDLLLLRRRQQQKRPVNFWRTNKERTTQNSHWSFTNTHSFMPIDLHHQITQIRPNICQLTNFVILSKFLLLIFPLPRSKPNSRTFKCCNKYWYYSWLLVGRFAAKTQNVHTLN